MTEAERTPRQAAQRDGDRIERAEGERIVVTFDGRRCVHARQCVTRAPAVFLANTPGEWIFPDRMDVEALAAVIEDCPSGAIGYARRDGRPGEPKPAVNIAAVRENGPVAIRGEVHVAGIAQGERVTLCRCGLSANKPFCDNSHVEGGFVASGEPRPGDLAALAERGGRLDVTPLPDGPLRVTGPLEICSGTGRAVLRSTQVFFCRCGHSANKPYCDGSHKKAGFRAPGA